MESIPFPFPVFFHHTWWGLLFHGPNFFPRCSMEIQFIFRASLVHRGQLMENWVEEKKTAHTHTHNEKWNPIVRSISVDGIKLLIWLYDNWFNLPRNGQSALSANDRNFFLVLFGREYWSLLSYFWWIWPNLNFSGQDRWWHFSGFCSQTMRVYGRKIKPGSEEKFQSQPTSKWIINWKRIIHKFAQSLGCPHRRVEWPRVFARGLTSTCRKEGVEMGWIY